jgi:hypothetical protein
MNEVQKEEVSREGVIHRLQDTKTPDYEAVFDRDEAERSAFREDALSDQDARESAIVPCYPRSSRGTKGQQVYASKHMISGNHVQSVEVDRDI